MSRPVPLHGDFDAPELGRLARNNMDADRPRRILALATIDAGSKHTGGGQRLRAGWRCWHPARP